MQFAVLRERAGLKQGDVADAFGLDRSTVSKWETGENCPRTELLPKLAALYNCTVDDFFNTQPTP